MNTLAFFAGGAPGLPEILIILFVVLLLFGAKKLPELSRSLGRSLSEFKKGKDEGARLEASIDKEKKEKIADSFSDLAETSEEPEKAAAEPEKADDESEKA
jgi:sec-independent protein translocase protein TatA